jgi:multidrug efflux pump subunit AcrB
MQTLIAAAARHPVFSNLLMIVVLLSGLYGYTTLRKESMPSLNLDVISVSVAYPGAAASEVEEGILLKLENALKGLRGIKYIEGQAVESFASVTIFLKDKVKNKQKILEDVKNRVAQISTFPKDAEPPQVKEIISTSDAFLLILHGNAPDRVLHELGYDIKEEIMALGISQVSVTGVRNYEISIEVSKESLRAYGLTLQQVADAVKQSSLNLPGGSIRTKTEQYKIEIKGRRYTGDEYRNLVVVTHDDARVVRLAQIAHIRDGFEEEQSIGRYNGERAILFSINRTGNEDTLEIAQKVREYMAAKNPVLPPGMQLSTLADFSEEIEARISLLLKNGWQGLLLLFFALWLFLNLRLALWVTLGIPISFAVTGLILWSGDHTLNMINLFGLILVLGIVVDDAIVIGENTHYHLQRGTGPVEAAIIGTTEMAWPVIAAITTTIFAFMPLLFVSGMMGKFIAVLPIVVIATLLGSLLEGLFILPAHLGHKKQPSPRVGLAQRIRTAIDAIIHFIINKLYTPLYYLSLHFRYTTIALVLSCALATFGLVAGGFVSVVLFPDSDAMFLQTTVVFPNGTPIAVTEAAIERLEKGMVAVNNKYGHKSTEGVLIKGGYAESGGAGQSHQGTMWFTLVDTGKRQMHSQAILNALREETGPIPNAIKVQYSSLGGASPAVKGLEIVAFGNKANELEQATLALRRALQNYAGVFDIETDLKPGKRELKISLKPEARVLGITLQDLAMQLRQGFYGVEALKVQRGRDEVNIQVRYPPEQRANLSDLFKVRLRTAQGDEVPFEVVATVELKQSFAEILHRDGKRRVTLSAAIDKTKTTTENVVGDLQQKVIPQLQASYPGVEFTFKGAKAEGEESIMSLMIGFSFALFGIYAVLTLVFRSYAQPLLIMSTIPLGLIGAVVGHYLLGYSLTLLSLFGVVALAGVVVNDSLVLIDRINQGQREGETLWLSVQKAGPRRFRAIILTSITTVAGLLPLLAEKSYHAQDLQPMALSLAAGLVFATVLTLFFVPCLYLVMNDVRRIIYWLKTGDWPTAEAVEPASQETTRIRYNNG